VKEWKLEVATYKDAVAKAERSLEMAKAAVVKAEEELTKFEKKYKDSIRMKESLVLQSHKDRKVALEKAEASVKSAASALHSANEKLAVIEENDPPYFGGVFAECKTVKDIENRVAAIDAKNAAANAKRKEEEAKRKEEEEKRK